MKRRHLLISAPGLLVLPVRADEALVTALRRGGCALMMRHARTEPGIGDPPGFRPGACATQRNLSAEGREQARRIGAWFGTRSLTPAVVRSSAWCRCLDTATLAFGNAESWPPLDSFFGNGGPPPGTDAALREALARIPAGRFEAWVTHQVNISAFVREGTAMGEAVVVAPGDGAPRVLGRLAIAA